MSKLSYFVNQKKQLLKNTDYLKKGFYVLHNNLHTYLHLGTKHEAVKFPNGGTGLKHFFRLIVGRLFFTVYVPENGKKFRADSVYFTTVPNPNYRDAKFFDYCTNEKKVLTHCANTKRYDLYIKNRSKAAVIFPLPKLLYHNENELVYMEEIINSIDWQKDEDMSACVYNSLFNFYINYYSQCDGKSFSKSVEDNANLPSLLQMPEEITMTLHHGDLSADNFKFTRNKELFFFDFDHANLFPLYYDIFFLIFNEAIINGNWSGYDLLKSGAFDNYFRNIAEKNLYLKAFMRRFWLDRLSGVSERHKNNYLNLYKQLILTNL